MRTRDQYSDVKMTATICSGATSKLRVTGLYGRNPPVTDGFHSQRASKAENVFIWWRHHTVGSRGAFNWPARFLYNTYYLEML